MQTLGVVVLAGMGYLSGGGSKHRAVVATVVVIGGLITLLSLL
jgi:hypothetical protein